MDLKIDDNSYDEVSTLKCKDIKWRRDASNLAGMFVTHFNAEGWKNPMSVDEDQVKPDVVGSVLNEEDAGFIHIAAEANSDKIFVKTIAIDPDKDPADAKELLKNVIRVE